MAYSFTPIPDFVFDQVLSFTLGNTILDNAQDTYDSFSEEHTFSNGLHKRISGNSNLLMNPTARRGNAFWWGAGAAANYATGQADVEYANTPNFLYHHWVDTAGNESYWILVPSTAWTGDLSEKIDMTNSVGLVLSAEVAVSGYVAGDMYVDIVCYDNTNQVLAAAGDLNGLCQIKISGDQGAAVLEIAGTTPANTDYIRIRKWINAAADAATFVIRRIKVEEDTVATAYSDESSMVQYLSARYILTSSSETTSIANNTLTIIDFDLGMFDDPGTNRVSVDDGGANRWRFTADRYMKLRVSCRIGGEFAGQPLGAGENINIYLYKGGVLYSVLDRIVGDVIAIAAGADFSMQGSDIIELTRGDYLDIRIIHDAGGTYDFLTATNTTNYISIEEI
jgi:hypothetical protein